MIEVDLSKSMSDAPNPALEKFLGEKPMLSPEELQAKRDEDAKREQ